jgi:L-rhamnose-H+ transport protein
MGDSQLGLGLALAILGGVMAGVYAVPLKFTKKWEWQHSWLVYSVVGLFVFPWLLTCIFTVNLRELLSESAWILICGFGLAWGVGNVLWGMGLVRLGLALGGSLMMGIVSGMGSLVPLIVLQPDSLHTRRGFFVIAGNAVLIAGAVLCSRAGDLRARLQSAETETSSTTSYSFPLSLLIAILAGALSSMLNFSFAFSAEMQSHAVELGTPTSLASLSVWALALSAGFLANLAYCSWRIGRAGWSRYLQTGTLSHWISTILMGLTWFGGVTLYGIGASKMGPSGPVIGWPVFIGMTLVASNVAGLATGEWRGTSSRCVRLLLSGVAVIIASMVVIARGN